MRRLVLIGVLASACAGSSREAMLVERFFAAARLQDTSALSDFSTVSFNPRVEGTVQQFTVVDVANAPGRGDTETVAVDAHVRTPAGQLQQRRLVLTVERSPDGRLRIVGVR